MSNHSRFPCASKKPHRITTHGHSRIDDYFWLREKTSQEVIDYLESENDYTKEILGHTEKLQEELYEEMKGRIQETDEEVPTRVDDYYYYSRTEEGKQYSIYCRKHGSLAAEEVSGGLRVGTVSRPTMTIDLEPLDAHELVGPGAGSAFEIVTAVLSTRECFVARARDA